ncbi:hypothetical protein KUCAC02_028246 [Chaenocephalus aceratus]|uniref:Uncharacterized protein n=1 Tax=Chaenocephalus aceratus TaxID=36190 RepID=A0ACB9X2V6_CHAAC|nr:hypothetical protein KUCAC02_028246 [Chaenocephalus aceratus]
MELSRRKVASVWPGEVFALLDGFDSLPEDAEVSVVLEGSTLVHVHNLAEVVSVQAYLCSETTPLTWVGGASLEYVQDDAQDLAEHLVVHGHCLSSRDHKDLSSLFNLGQQSSRWAMDRRVALAMANLDIPQNWNVLGSHSGDEHNFRESPLHMAVRWPGGLMAVSLPNEEGVTPLQLAQTAGNTELLELLTTPPQPSGHASSRSVPGVGRPVPPAQNLRWSSEDSRHADILLLRDRLRDEDFLREIKALRRERVETLSGKEELVDDPVETALYSEMKRAAVEENDYEELLMFCLHEEDAVDDPSHFDSGKDFIFNIFLSFPSDQGYFSEACF